MQHAYVHFANSMRKCKKYAKRLILYAKRLKLYAKRRLEVCETLVCETSLCETSPSRQYPIEFLAKHDKNNEEKTL